MKPLLIELDAADGLAEGLCDLLDAERGAIERRRFPDGESYLRLACDVQGRDVIVLCTLNAPDEKLLPLLFAADAAREQGALGVGLAAPYLAYMRQDKAFRPGEAITSRSFARLLGERFDWLATLDPHLHRYPTLASLYAIPAVSGSAAEPIAQWVREHVGRPWLIGPDEESAQWVERIAALAGTGSAVFRKTRRGDRDVSLELTGVELPEGVTPVIVDDIASSARTMAEAVKALRDKGHPAPWCIAVHAIFAGDAYAALKAARPAGIVSTNSVAHPSNAIGISAPLAEAIRAAMSTISHGRGEEPSTRG